MSETFQQIGTRVGGVVEEKNAAYGSSFETAPAALRLLYPKGIAPAQMADALLLVRIWDKQMRIATDRDALGENPYQDIAGYGILGVALHQSKETPSCPGSARRPDALDSSKAHPDSAASQKSEPTTTSADANRSETSSPWPENCFVSTSELQSILNDSALIPAVTARAARREAVHAAARSLNQNDRCGYCGQDLTEVRFNVCFFRRTGIPPEGIQLDSLSCRERFISLINNQL